MTELGDQAETAIRERTEAAIARVEEVLKGDDKAAIEQAANDLQQAAMELHQQAARASEAAQQATADDSGGADAGSPEDVVDAEFTEVDEDRK